MRPFCRSAAFSRRTTRTATLDVLATGQLPLELVAAAKSLAHWLTTGIPLALLAPVLGILLNLDLKSYPILIATMLAGTPAVSFLGAIGAALTLKARRGGLLLAVIVLPLYIPTLIFGISAVSATRGPRWRRCGVSRFDGDFACGNCIGADRGGGRPAHSVSLNGNLAVRCAALTKGLNPADANTHATTRQPDPVHGAFGSRVLPWVSAAAAALLVYGLYLAFFASPADYQQGETVRIMYIHVPSAWLSMMIYGLIAVSSFGLLVFRHPLADVSAKAAAPIGAAFTFLALFTGSLWGKPMWGTYWVWDARLTSVLILFFLYLGLMALRASLEDEAAAAKLTAVLALVGVTILPIIKFSVEWWNTLHQPSTDFTSTVDPSMRWPLLVMAVGFTLMFFAMHLKAMRNEILRRRVKAMRAQAVAGRDRLTAPAAGE